MTEKVEIFYSDLKPAAQQALLDLYGLEDPSDANWDFIPLMTFENYGEDEE